MSSIRKQIEDTTSDYDREKLQERLAKLAGGVAVIQVGAATEVEMKERKLRIEDALAASPRGCGRRASCPEAGIAFINVRSAVQGEMEKFEGDAKTGVDIILRALEEPLRQIAKNAGVDGSVIVDKIVTSGKSGYGFDALKGDYVDMVERGIIDPTKVTPAPRCKTQRASPR